MQAAERQDFESQANTLRNELKQWEASWAAEHSGSKPDREDIKHNTDISQKYKSYNKVRDILSGKIPPPLTRSAAEDADARPRKRARRDEHTAADTKLVASTPRKDRSQAPQAWTEANHSSEKTGTPRQPTSIGPTPQRNGRVLGLFDLFDDKDVPTPSKPAVAGNIILATPSKSRTSSNPDIALSLGQTPRSTGKEHLRTPRQPLTTPLKVRENNDEGLQTSSQSVSKLSFNTPAFLRRAKMPTLDENGAFLSPEPMRLPRKPFGRSLSSTVASLRQMEEEALDEDLDILHEIEGGAPTAPKPRPATAPAANVQVEDSQQNRLLGGFDDEAAYDSPVEEALDRDGQPLKVYAKKGQKRTTRKVNMKPTRYKRPTTLDTSAEGDDEGGDVVPETQYAPPMPLDDEDNIFSRKIDADDEYTEHATAVPKSRPMTKPKSQKADAVGKVKKVVKKVNELAHANFKRLKLRNNGAKGGPGQNSRFRRRR